MKTQVEIRLNGQPFQQIQGDVSAQLNLGECASLAEILQILCSDMSLRNIANIVLRNVSQKYCKYCEMCQSLKKYRLSLFFNVTLNI